MAVEMVVYMREEIGIKIGVDMGLRSRSRHVSSTLKKILE